MWHCDTCGKDKPGNEMWSTNECLGCHRKAQMTVGGDTQKLTYDKLMTGYDDLTKELSRMEAKGATTPEHMIQNPSHYSDYDHEPISCMRERMTDEQFEGLLWGCAMKYVMRYPDKDSKYKNVCKAIQYLEWLKEGLEDDHDTFTSDKVTLP